MQRRMTDQVPALPNETIGQRLKRLRLERGLSQRELAAPGVSYAYISRIEAGTRQPSVKALRRLAGKLEVSVSYLETGSHLEPDGARELTLTDLELAVRLGAAAGAEEPLEALLIDAHRAGDRESALRARVSLAILAKERGDYGRMVTLLEEVLEGEPFAPVERAELYTQLGYAYSASGRPDLAVALYERCLDDVRERGDAPSLEARYATMLSYALSDAGDLSRAEDVVKETLVRIHSTEDSYTRVRLYWSLARLAHAESRPGLALANARKAIALLEATEDTHNLARAHLLAASIMVTRGEPDAANEHLDDAERLLGAAPSFADGAMLRVKRAQVAALREDGAAAVELARAALAAIGDALPEERGAAYFVLGDGFALESDYERADDAYRSAVQLLEEQHQWREATQACRSWARMLRSAGREDQALDVLDRAAELGLKAAPADSVRS
jgi:transcriptional regulator with XRE-family HTH domain